MTDVVKRWNSVLRKCQEYSEDQYESLAQLLENQYNAWVDHNDLTSGATDIADFTRFALPVVRKALKKLWDAGFEVNILEKDYGTMEWTVACVNGSKLLIEAERFPIINREAVMVDAISDQFVKNISEDFPEKVLNLFLLLVPNPEPLPKQELEVGDKRMVMRVQV
jgi:hypothetical protein